MIGGTREYDVNCNYRYDFFAQRKKDFYDKFSHKSILCQGRHWESTPLVTILITTYKRPVLLRQALSSALNQKGFDDYQIIIADNEGAPIEEETPTAKVVKEYENDKIIYYRHSQEVTFKADSAVRLAKSPWIVFLHDDDMLAENHLATMTNIVKKWKEIKFLACRAEEFIQGRDIERGGGSGNGSENYAVVKLLKNATCFGNWTGWLGALISREHYIAMGGMPTLVMGCGDKAMVCTFHHHFGTYKCDSSWPLYYYRVGEQQISYTQRDTWERVLIEEYCFERYVIRRYHEFTHKIWERNLAYKILQRCEFYRDERYYAQIDVGRVIAECGMPNDIRKRNFMYYAIKGIFFIYRGCARYLALFNMRVIRRSEMKVDF